MAGMGALESLNKDGEVWPDREASSFSIQYCVNPRLKQCHCGGTDVGGVVTPCQTHGGKFRKGEMMVCYGDGLQTFCHVTCVSHDLANGYMLEGVDDEYESAGKDGDDPGLGGYLQGMDDLEPSHAEWATAYLKAMRYGENAKAATLLESVPKPRREPAKKRPEAAADAPAGFPAKKPKAAPKEPKPPAGPLRPLKASISGKVFAITGVLQGHLRADFEAHVAYAGASVSDKVDVNTTALIVTEMRPGKAKLDKATMLGVPRLSEAEFWDEYGTTA